MSATKAQISVEYITTYSWALVIVAVIVGTLIYYGAFRNEEQITESCNMGAQIKCENFYINNHGEISIELRNDINDKVNIIDFKINNNEANCEYSNSIIYPGDKVIIFCKTSENYNLEDKETVNIELLFKTASSTRSVSSSIINEPCKGF